jgi:hypothetical protein
VRRGHNYCTDTVMLLLRTHPWGITVSPLSSDFLPMFVLYSTYHSAPSGFCKMVTVSIFQHQDALAVPIVY